MGLVDNALWENRQTDPEAIEAELRGPKGRSWLMRWLPARAHDNGVFLVYSNGIGVDDNEIRTGNAMILDPYGRILAETWKAGDDMVVTDLNASLLQASTEDRYLGRVLGALNTTNALLVLGGQALASALGDRLGIVPMLNLSALLYLPSAIVALTMLSGSGGPAGSYIKRPVDHT